VYTIQAWKERELKASRKRHTNKAKIERYSYYCLNGKITKKENKKERYFFKYACPLFFEKETV